MRRRQLYSPISGIRNALFDTTELDLPSVSLTSHNYSSPLLFWMRDQQNCCADSIGGADFSCIKCSLIEPRFGARCSSGWIAPTEPGVFPPMK